jgi:hypothetical protein
MYPAMLELSDVPNRHELADQLRRVAGVAVDGEPAGVQSAKQIPEEGGVESIDYPLADNGMPPGNKFDTYNRGDNNDQFSA